METISYLNNFNPSYSSSHYQYYLPSTHYLNREKHEGIVETLLNELLRDTYIDASYYLDKKKSSSEFLLQKIRESEIKGAFSGPFGQRESKNFKL